MSEPQALYALLAPSGQLTGNGQLRETVSERRNRKGNDVAFICGSDEHGAANTLRAKKDGVAPQEIVDKYHKINKKILESALKLCQLKSMFDVLKRLPQNISINPRKFGLQLVLIICWGVIIVGTFSFLN